MKKIHCDICGKEIKSDNPINKIWDSELFVDTDNEYIEDVCEECFKIILCCINMMKYTKWKPDFHEVLKQDDIWKREMAGYKLCDLEKKFNVEF